MKTPTHAYLDSVVSGRESLPRETVENAIREAGDGES